MSAPHRISADDHLPAAGGTAELSEVLPSPELPAPDWLPPKPFLKYKPSVRKRGEWRRDALALWFLAVGRGALKQQAAVLASAEYQRCSGRAVSPRQVYRWVKLIEARGGQVAPIEAYCDEKECPHRSRRSHVPEELIAALRSKSVEPGNGEWSSAVRFFQLSWAAGAEVPGLGRPGSPGEPFPFTASQLRRYKPSKAARVQGSRGKFAAKAAGLLPAPPISNRNLRLREQIIFDDKRLDVVALDDQTGRQVSLVLCLAMDASTSQILGYVLRCDGGLRQSDVEELTCFVLRVCGFAGRSAGYATTLIYERGTVAISADRQALLEMLFPGQINIRRTSMIGGSGPGGFRASAGGNYFGKGRIESFMATLDKVLRHVPGQRGNKWANQPLMLGDTTATPEQLAHPNYRLKGSQIEEALLCAQAGVALRWLDGADGKIVAMDASRGAKIEGPLLYVSEVNSAIQTVLAFYNAERGHRREGFEQIAGPADNGGQRFIAESGNDKAARLEAALAAQGRSLAQISAADAAALLHRCKKIIVRPNGARVRIGGVERVYWSANSVAVAAAQHSSLGEKTFLALHNQQDPRELYLLHNPPSHFMAKAGALPPGEAPHFFEALPLYTAPDANDESALAERAASVAAVHSRVTLETNRAALPWTAAQTARRERNLEALQPLRDAVSVLRDAAPRAELPASPVGEAFGARAQQDAAREKYHASLRRVTAREAEEFDER